MLFWPCFSDHAFHLSIPEAVREYSWRGFTSMAEVRSRSSYQFVVHLTYLYLTVVRTSFYVSVQEHRRLIKSPSFLPMAMVTINECSAPFVLPFWDRL
ncbi:hypothetical protein ARMGADRAFT_797476 [Armillaria gallica]|uniref:Uncharacterized protein n=1 Tax=Armillaria gallica TaxID=47427 RepID=A0A2H3DWZ5_ARMGA|nr:hypothetical protein ARMGADRAFT_797476 [Armillaria gallica]